MSRNHCSAVCTFVIAALLSFVSLSANAFAEEIPWRLVPLNPQSEFSSAAALDVNEDGRLDVVSGGFWYAAPDWKKQKLREVEMIRGRYDDYSNLPLDVDGDGDLDIVSVNYRSSSLYWSENTGPGGGLWPKHVIDKPGPSETGRLHDMNGDGRLDVLPNGTKFSAWYELTPASDKEKTVAPYWRRHEIPGQLAGHGIGFGDLNGDGRGDIVGPLLWLESPKNPGQDRWLDRHEFRTARDASVPILVHDIDGDGDGDVIYGRGHNIGLYWLEQYERDGQRRWRQQAIDTSWSQLHAPLLADIDGDGRQDIVGGKRYLGHDGKDPGEYDPLVVYWYRYEKDSGTFSRHPIHFGGRVGMDLDPKAVDIDADGDIDLLASARSGLYLLENLRIDSTPDASRPAIAQTPAPEYADHSRLMVYQDAAGKQHPITTPQQWGIRRAHILAGMERAMGPLPGPQRRVPLDVKILASEELEDYTRKKITYVADSGDRVPAWLLIPRSKAPMPAMLCLHPTNVDGKDQTVDLVPRENRSYGHELAKQGFVCLVPDYPSFGEYKDYDFENDQYVSGTMKAIWNNIRGVDLLESLPEVQADSIGAIGHSLGGHNALYTAAFDQRIRCVVSSCGFNAFEDYYGGNLKGWTSTRYMPRIAELYKNDPRQMPFDWHEVLAAAAPRPVYVNAPLHDANFAVVGVRKAVSAAEQVYQLRGAKENLKVAYPDAAHDFPPEVREDVYRWLKKVLN